MAGMTESGTQKVDSGFSLEDCLIPSPFTHQETSLCLLCETAVAALLTHLHTMVNCTVNSFVLQETKYCLD